LILWPICGKILFVNTKQHSQKHILIVEDEYAIAHTLQLKLQHCGYNVETASNGEEAKAFFEKNPKTVDVILLDLIMPVMNGFDFLEYLQKTGNTIPVIVSSNLSQEEDIVRAKELGAVDYYVKSEISVSDVVEHVEAIIGKNEE